MTDGILPYDVVRDMQMMKRRIEALEKEKPQVAMPIPHSDVIIRSANGYHATTNTSDSLMTLSRAPLSARYLHYDITKDDSLLGGGGNTTVKLYLYAIPISVATSVTLTQPEPGPRPNDYYGAIDLYEHISDTYKGKEIRIALSAARSGGSGSVQVRFNMPLMLKAQDYAFYGG